MKKYFALFLALVMAVSLMACGTTPATTDPETTETDVSEDTTSVEDKYDLENAKDATADDLIGTWNYIGLKKAGEWTDMADQQFVIAADSFTYGEYASANSITGNVMDITDWGCTMTCWYNADGQLVIYDSRDMYYVLEAAPEADVADEKVEEVEETTETTTPDAPKYDIAKSKDATADQLPGTWNYIALQKGGEWTDMTSQTFVIAADTFTYGEYVSANSISGNVMDITDWGCTMTCWFNAKGQLVIYDSRDMYYLCTK